MPKARENFILLYWDKVLLLILAAVGIYVFMTRVLSSPIKTSDLPGKSLPPHELAGELVQQTAELQRRLQQAEPPEVKPPDYFEQISKSLESIPRDLANYPLTPNMPGREDITVNSIATPAVLTPVNLRCQSGLGLVTGSAASPARRVESVQPVSSVSGPPTYWVTIAAEFPFYKQHLAIAGLDPLIDEDRRLPKEDQQVLFARLELERQQLLPDGSWSDAEQVSPYELYSQALPKTINSLKELYTLSSDDEKTTNVDSLRSWLKRSGFQEFIVRPEFFSLQGFEQWYWPEKAPDLTDRQTRLQTLAGAIPRDDAPRYRAVDRTATPTATAIPTYRDRRLLPFGLGGPDIMFAPDMTGFPEPTTGPIRSRTRTISTGRGRFERIPIPQGYGLENVPDTIQMWAHDSTVLPGRTYRYRMRLLLFNPLCGNERAESRKVRTLAWLEGPWSQWSEPVEAMQKRYFFFTSVSARTDTRPPRARVSVYAWQDGWWYPYPFSYGDPGQSIGSPMDVPDYTVSSSSSRTFRLEGLTSTRSSGRPGSRTRPPGPGPRPKINVDFTTGWTFVDLNLDVQLDQPVDNASASSEAVTTTSELVVKDQATGQLATRYSALDSDDPQKQWIEEVISRQEKAFREIYMPPERRLDRRPRAPGMPFEGFGMPNFGPPRRP